LRFNPCLGIIAKECSGKKCSDAMKRRQRKRRRIKTEGAH
jgi:hypothetical protein